jgi:uncharacterized protein (DUF4415 family)
MMALTGDKVRVKSGAHRGLRGVVEGVEGASLTVRYDGSETTAQVPVEAVTNLSLAARKAWASMPERRVGRPRGSRVCDRVSVTLRIDRALWQRFRGNEATGQIEDRTTTINTWLRQKLDELSVNRHAG